ncbi:MAG TPA: serine hydrolase domain-containing protein [Pseudonocardiaceae bacterium]|jgi:CubicO group peptidase (beta-lactamase class C family)|nr:serine hydrolase domain-containing protein [Pseudonocardiaceae bacterium]
MTFDHAHWQARLATLRVAHRVPGASLAVLADGEIHEFATGVLNLRTGVTATPDSIFQVGSIGKLYTATLIMQHVAAGDLELDTPVVDVLPEFAVADAEATKTITIRHLLQHTSGMGGDFFLDTGRGDDCIAKYVAACANLGQNHPPGATVSYCNSGYTVLGRVIEVLTGQVWDTALAERLCAPLGLTSTMTLPEDVLRFRAAMGHIGKLGAEQRLAPRWTLARSAGRPGLICASAADVIRFVTMHLDQGRAPDGTEILAAEQVAAMQRPEVEVPDRWSSGSRWGLCWRIHDCPGGPMISHNGTMIGQFAYLRVVPAARLAIVLLTNGGDVRLFHRALLGELLGELAGIDVPVFAPPTPPPTVDVRPYVGAYRGEGKAIDVAEHDGVLRIRVENTTNLKDLHPVSEVDLVPVTDSVFAGRRSDSGPWQPVVFYTLPDGRPYLHTDLRATPKID